MGTFSERLQYLIICKNLDQTSFANKAGFDKTQVNKWLANRTKSPQKKTVRKICDFFNCNFDWLSIGKGEPFSENHDNRRSLVANARNNANAIAANGCYNVSINHSGMEGKWKEGKGKEVTQGRSMEVSEREQKLVERMRLYASAALWAKIEAELDEQEKKFK